MKQIWLVRHAQSKSQIGEDEDGRDPELSKRGKRQARRLIAPLKHFKLDRILISPLKRAWQTYQLSQANAPVAEFDSRIAESDWGIPNYYQGILPLNLPDIAQADRHHALLIPAEKRVSDLVSDLLNASEQSILLFGHWGIFVHLFWVFSGMNSGKNMFQATMDNTGISLLEVDDDGNRYLRFWNERTHVSDLL